jgi:hypothetical protein
VVDERTLAYVAGVVDLLGLIRVRTLPESGTQLPVVQMHGNHLPTFSYLGELTGTKAIVVRRDYARAGCAEHCREKHLHVTSRSGRWSLTGAKATVLLWNVRPYLRVQADAAREALEVGLRTHHKPGTLRRMAELGWELPDLEAPTP